MESRRVITKREENAEELVRAFFITKLKMEPDNVERIRFVRCHRMGGKHNKYTAIRHRQIIVRFQNFYERQTVWSARRNLGDKSLSINENFCVDTEYNWRKLYPIFRLAKSMDKYKKTGIFERGYSLCE